MKIDWKSVSSLALGAVAALAVSHGILEEDQAGTLECVHEALVEGSVAWDSEKCKQTGEDLLDSLTDQLGLECFEVNSTDDSPDGTPEAGEQDIGVEEAPDAGSH